MRDCLFFIYLLEGVKTPLFLTCIKLPTVVDDSLLD